MLHLLQRQIAKTAPSRRTFLKLSAGAAGGLMIGLKLPSLPLAAACLNW